ncbi:MAG: carboxylating nicotinate-nucleotide diphosphorylase [Pseudohongiellaceae bacterium]|nr:carboxylating nicotinate-nucleotide diphosphorylase [Pseudohongiellaceae bacterium]
MTTLPSDIESTVSNALREDVGSGDITAQLIGHDTQANASIYARENAIFCGTPWANEVLRQVDPSASIQWHVQDGDSIESDQRIASLSGLARSLLTAERNILNFIQTLSGTASICFEYAQMTKHTEVRLLDTRKTIPGLRTAQKYAVKIGGCHNHRIGLYDAFLIKENHINACGSISKAIQLARQLHSDKPVEVEVETLEQLREALTAKADTIMLDNFPLAQLQQAVALNKGQAKLEASGGVNKSTLVPIAETGVDFISIGALTKNCRAIDLSMLFD